MLIGKRPVYLFVVILSFVVILTAIFLVYCSYRYNKVMEIDISVGINEGMSVPIGAFIGHSYDGTVMPLLLGFIVCSLASIVLVFWTEMKGNA